MGFLTSPWGLGIGDWGFGGWGLGGRPPPPTPPPTTPTQKKIFNIIFL